MTPTLGVRPARAATQLGAPPNGCRHRRTPVRARVAMAGLAVALLLTLGGLDGSSRTALAATPDLSVVTSTRYDVRPDDHRIDVTVELTATNNLVDSATTQFAYERAFLAVQPEATAYQVRAPGETPGRPTPTVVVDEDAATHTLLRIEFGMRLAAGRSLDLVLTYRLPDAGTPVDREFRVGTVTTLRLWALATTGTPGSTVSLAVPADASVSFARGTLSGPTTDAAGRRVWSSRPVDDPLKFDVFVRVDMPPAYVESALRIDVAGGIADLTLRAWDDDPAWAEHVGHLLQAGIPELESEIGLPWPIDGSLVVQEAFEPESGGIAGSFDPDDNRIEIVHTGGSEIALHEAAHAWFNGGLLADRWANEAFASFYAEAVAAKLDLPFEPAAVTPELRPARVPLNAWATGDAPPPQDAERSAIEAYGYAKSTELAREIAERVGAPGLRRLWSAITDSRAPYQPPGGPAEFLTGPPDWRGLLDLIEDDGTAEITDLWAAHVVLPAEAPDLEARASTRSAYADVLALAGDWQLPLIVRDALRSWQFEAASAQLAAATVVLGDRAELENATAATGVSPPTDLRERFETASDLATVATELRADLEALAAVAGAQTARRSTLGLIEWLGLIGSSPTLQLADAVAAVEAGDPGHATELANAAEATWLGAAEAGRIRLGGAAVLALACAAVALALTIRRRNRRRE